MKGIKYTSHVQPVDGGAKIETCDAGQAVRLAMRLLFITDAR